MRKRSEAEATKGKQQSGCAIRDTRTKRRRGHRHEVTGGGRGCVRVYMTAKLHYEHAHARALAFDARNRPCASAFARMCVCMYVRAGA
eukprot:2844223-Pleurochrysis_carterae.AAC.1